MLIKKSISTLKHDGLKVFAQKSFFYIKRKIHQKQIVSKKNSKDILFINGCTLPHPSRYRVEHQIEQLNFYGYSCDSIYYEDLTLEMLKYYRGFIFFRCPYTELIEEFIHKAKYFNKKVFFDIDDLVIDYQYVKEISYLKTMTKEEYTLYMSGVERMHRTLLLCDVAITTTAALSNELEKYTSNVYINRNVASEEMVSLSLHTLKNRTRTNEKVILGYFSGSITHNDDFLMILPVVRKILKKYSNCYLKIVGILDVPPELEDYKEQVITEKFMDWRKLPEVIASVDINLAPLTNSIFNSAKSEIKWLEAALVKVPTISSRLGAFEEMVKHERTGILAGNLEEWEVYLEQLILEKEFRERIAEEAHQYVLKHCISANTGLNLSSILKKHLRDNIMFVLPSTQISGGVNVVIKHCNILRNAGMDVTIVSMGDNDQNIVNQDGELNVLCNGSVSFHSYFQKAVGTLWSTLEFISSYPKIRDKFYLVQNFETNFYKHGHVFRVWANLTYNSFYTLKYITISTWCKDWLKTQFGQEAGFALNGLDLNRFSFQKRDFSGKIRILVEGNSADFYKNVDESFRIVNSLDRTKFEIWYLSYNGKPKEWYKYDKFLHKVPYDEVSEIYKNCHILIKSSLLESFSYPPLEMMATGGVAIVAPNEGNVEYLKDRENCLLYEQGNIDDALSKIEEIYRNSDLRDSLISGGLITAKHRSWDTIEGQILKLYEYDSIGAK